MKKTKFTDGMLKKIKVDNGPESISAPWIHGRFGLTYKTPAEFADGARLQAIFSREVDHLQRDPHA